MSPQICQQWTLSIVLEVLVACISMSVRWIYDVLQSQDLREALRDFEITVEENE